MLRSIYLSSMCCMLSLLSKFLQSYLSCNQAIYLIHWMSRIHGLCLTLGICIIVKIAYYIIYTDYVEWYIDSRCHPDAKTWDNIIKQINLHHQPSIYNNIFITIHGIRYHSLDRNGNLLSVINRLSMSFSIYKNL